MFPIFEKLGNSSYKKTGLFPKKKKKKLSNFSHEKKKNWAIFHMKKIRPFFPTKKTVNCFLSADWTICPIKKLDNFSYKKIGKLSYKGWAIFSDENTGQLFIFKKLENFKY